MLDVEVAARWRWCEGRRVFTANTTRVPGRDYHRGARAANKPSVISISWAAGVELTAQSMTAMDEPAERSRAGVTITVAAATTGRRTAGRATTSTFRPRARSAGLRRNQA